MSRTIVWDDENIRHLLIDRADRDITIEEVEEILTSPDTVRQPARAGRDRYIGRTAAGRHLAVIAIGDLEVRPETAWAITQSRWRNARG